MPSSKFINKKKLDKAVKATNKYCPIHAYIKNAIEDIIAKKSRGN